DPVVVKLEAHPRSTPRGVARRRPRDRRRRPCGPSPPRHAAGRDHARGNPPSAPGARRRGPPRLGSWPARLDRPRKIALKISRLRPNDPEMSARSERTTSGSALFQGVGFRRAARLALALLIGMLVISAFVRGDIGLTGAGALAGIVVGVTALWEARVRRIGIRIEPQGILAVYAVGHLRFPLESVSGFS